MDRRANWPRVLIVSAGPLEADNATGLTLRGLFGDFPRESLAQVVLTGSHSESRHQTYQLPAHAIPIDWFGRALVGQTTGASAAILATQASESLGNRWAIRREMRAVADLSPLMTPARMRAFVRDFAPTVVYSLLGSARMLVLASRCSSIAAAPLVPHFMDDWPSTLYSDGELGGHAKRRVQKLLRRITADAPVILCIGDAMADEYRKLYGKQTLGLMRPSTIGPLTPPPDGKVIRFAYIGGLHLGRDQQLLRIAGALQTAGLSAVLDVYAPPADLAVFAPPESLASHLRICGSLAPEEVRAHLQRSDVLVHVESFDGRAASYTRLSLSTKLPQYMEVGRPILAFGPQEQAGIHLVRTARLGLAAGAEWELIEIISQLVESPELRRSLGKNARAYAESHYATERTRARLRDVLTTAPYSARRETISDGR